MSKVAIRSNERESAFDPVLFLNTEGTGRRLLKYRRGQVVFSQGSWSDAVFYIRDGNVKVTVISKWGKERVIAILGPHEFFGESCLASRSLRLVTLRAMAECNIVRLGKDVMLKVLQEEPAFSAMFITHLLNRTIRIQQDLVDQLLNSSEKRLARALLLLPNFGNDGAAQKVVKKINQETLADMVGTTRSRVSHFMNKFRKRGLIGYDSGRLEVHHSLLQAVLSEKSYIRSRRANELDPGADFSSHP